MHSKRDICSFMCESSIINAIRRFFFFSFFDFFLVGAVFGVYVPNRN